jgi:hypothetical protein
LATTRRRLRKKTPNNIIYTTTNTNQQIKDQGPSTLLGVDKMYKGRIQKGKNFNDSRPKNTKKSLYLKPKGGFQEGCHFSQ